MKQTTKKTIFEWIMIFFIFGSIFLYGMLRIHQLYINIMIIIGFFTILLLLIVYRIGLIRLTIKDNELKDDNVICNN